MPFPPFNLGKGREDRFSVRQDYLCLSFEYMGLTVHSDNDEHQSSRSWIFVRFSFHVLLFNYPRLVFDNAHPINFLTKKRFRRLPERSAVHTRQKGSYFGTSTTGHQMAEKRLCRLNPRARKRRRILSDPVFFFFLTNLLKTDGNRVDISSMMRKSFKHWKNIFNQFFMVHKS